MKLTVVCLFAAITAGAQSTTERLPVTDAEKIADAPIRPINGFWLYRFMKLISIEGAMHLPIPASDSHGMDGEQTAVKIVAGETKRSEDR